MSGIVGSKLNIRGSGLVGSLGTDGQHLLSAGAGVTNVFETAAGGGKVLQILQDTATVEVHTTAGTSTYVDTGLSQAITPASTDSTILAFVSLSNCRKTTDTGWTFRLVRTTTGIADFGNYDTADDTQLTEVCSFSYLDSPSTTSATTYKVTMASGNGKLAANTNAAILILMEIGA